METALPTSADDVAALLGDTGYLCDEALATVAFLALRMQRPLLLEGEPGTGKTALAEALAARLGETGYLCDDELATVTFLALRMQRPLLLEGEPGTGKTALAEAVAASLDLPLVRLCLLYTSDAADE